MELEIGVTVGDYRVIGVVGSGGTGKVYKVQNVITERFEAMKVLLPDLANEPKLAERFMREIRVHSGLEHPNIASFRTALRVGNQLLLVMELVEGITLLDKLEAGPLVPATAIDYTTQVLSALECAHSHGVIHRDVKLSNMMLTPAGVVKLLDFGIAKRITDHDLTLNDTTLGSPYYIAPEQIQGAATVDKRADLYSVGISLYEMVTGKKPFDGPDRFSIMFAHVKEIPVPPLEVNRQLPKALSDLILKAVAKSPDGRFQTAAAFHEALTDVAAMPPTAQPAAVSRPTPARAPGGARQARRWRGVGMALGAVTLAAAAIAITQLGPWPIQLDPWRMQLGSWPRRRPPEKRHRQRHTRSRRAARNRRLAADRPQMLKDAMGANYPPALPRQMLRRADRLLDAHQYPEAGLEYQSLLGQLTGLERDQARVRIGVADYLNGNTAAAYPYLTSLELPQSEAPSLEVLRQVRAREKPKPARVDRSALVVAAQAAESQSTDNPRFEGWRGVVSRSHVQAIARGKERAAVLTLQPGAGPSVS